MKLSEAVEGVLDLDRLIEEHADELLVNGGVLPPAVAEAIDQAHKNFDEKLERCGLYLLRQAQPDLEAARLEKARITQRVKVMENALDGFKAYVLGQVLQVGKGIKSALVTVRAQKNSAPTFVAEPAPPAFVPGGSAAGEVDGVPGLFLRLVAPPPPPPVYEWDKDAVLNSWKLWSAYEAAHAQWTAAGAGTPEPEPPALPRPPKGFIIEQRSHLRVH